MLIIRKISIASQTMRKQGIAGVLKVLARKLDTYSRRKLPVSSLWEIAPLFRYATCDDLIQLKARYPIYCYPDRESKEEWGLKTVGRLYCVDKIIKLKPNTMIEVGAGWSPYFDQHFGEQNEYWMLDDGCYDPFDKFDLALKNRQNTHFVQGMLGDFNPKLPAEYFDLVFSVSVLEHVPSALKNEVYNDMYRILKPGGWIVHSIDLLDFAGLSEFDYISQAGFVLPSKADLHFSIRPSDGPATLFEPLEHVFNYQLGIGNDQKWHNPPSVYRHLPTILVMGYKPDGEN
ncbi:class I SAM-dependent methyltransferase [candidate division CSSED10-310 bacterium]|uniref:Class I SAM-dependent methyltransferase n=1 Tax=candidate division CSSED10-310 bacterium TaxID=2855610 RepID=A0ABV6YUX4_UNCC1